MIPKSSGKCFSAKSLGIVYKNQKASIFSAELKKGGVFLCGFVEESAYHGKFSSYVWLFHDNFKDRLL